MSSTAPVNFFVFSRAAQLTATVHAAVFCVDEKSAIQALDRLDPVLPLSPGRAERHGFEYYRHGTLSLYAALNTCTGEVLGQTSPRHTSAVSDTELSAASERQIGSTEESGCAEHTLIRDHGNENA